MKSWLYALALACGLVYAVSADHVSEIPQKYRFQPAEKSSIPPDASQWSTPAAYWPAAQPEPGSAWAKTPRQKINSIWIESLVNIPETSCKRFELDFTRINGNAIIFVNGKKSGERLGPYGRIELAGLQPGKNTLWFFVTRDYTDVSRKFESDLLRYTARGPNAVWGTIPMCEWSLGLNSPVYLLSYSDSAGITDAWFKTSFRKKELEVECDLAVGKVAGQLSIGVKIFADDGMLALEIPPRQIADPKDKMTVKLKKSWPEPKLWELDAPYMYKAAVTVYKNDKPIDSKKFRFGFREVWTEGRNLMINGHIQRLRLDWAQNGYSTPNGISLLKYLGRNAVYYQSNPSGWWRNWWGEVFYFQKSELDLMDDNGIAVFLPAPTANFGRDKFLNDPEFIRQYKQEYAEHVKRYRNHPSVIAWCYSMNSFCPKDAIEAATIGRRADYQQTMGKVLAAVTEMSHEIDPTRLTYGHADGNVGDIASGNTYPNLTPLQEVEDYPEIFAQKGNMPWWACEYGLYNGSLYKGKQFLLTEYAAINFGPEAYYKETPEQLAKTLEIGLVNKSGHGDNFSKYVKHTPMYWELEREFYKSTNRAWRTYGVLAWHFFDFGIGYGNPPEVRNPDKWQDRYSVLSKPVTSRPEWANPAMDYNRDNMQPLLAYIGGNPKHTDKTHNFYGGETFTKSVAAVWDGPGILDFKATVNLKSGGKTLKKHVVAAKLNPGDVKEFPVEFTLPEVKVKSAFTLELAAKDQHGKLVADVFTLTAFPKSAQVKLKGQIRLFDPEKRSAWIKEIAANVKDFQTGTTIKSGDILVIGREALKVGQKLPVTPNDIVNGVRVVVLEQKPEVLEALGFRTIESAPRTVFVNSPALRLDDADLRHWRGTPDMTPEFKHARAYDVTIAPKTSNRNVVASVMIEIPQAVGFVPLTRGEFDLNYTSLLQFAAGKGVLLFSTFDFSNRALEEPAAARLAANILEIADGKFAADRKVFALPGAAAELNTIKIALKNGSDYTDYTAAPEQSLLLLAKNDTIDGNTAKKFIANGGRIVLIDSKMTEAFGLKSVPAKVWRGEFSKSINPLFAPNLWRWRDVLEVRRLKSGSAQVQMGGLFATIPGDKGGAATFLQVAPSQLSGRYQNDSDKKEAVALSVIRLRQLLSQVITAEGVMPEAKTLDRITKVHKGLAFKDLDNWFVLGPFKAKFPNAFKSLDFAYNGQAQALSGDLNPNLTYDNGAGKKLDFRKTINADSGGFVNLAKAFGSDRPDTVGYAVKLINSDSNYKAMLRLGVDYFMVIYVNGKLVFDMTRNHSSPKANAFNLKINLKKGENVIVVKVMAGSKGFGFWANISEPGVNINTAEQQSKNELLYDPEIKLRSPYEYFYW